MNREQTLKEAARCVNGQRQQDYGTPEDNFSRIADLWTAYYGGRVVFAAVDVAMMMGLLKIARIATSDNPTEDSFVDLAGYAACGAEIATERKEDEA